MGSSAVGKRELVSAKVSSKLMNLHLGLRGMGWDLPAAWPGVAQALGPGLVATVPIIVHWLSRVVPVPG